MVLSDATIARLLAEGRIEIDPYDEALLQPSSVDVRVDRLFRVFHNNRYPFIDVKVEQAELTELVQVDDEHPFVLHPGEFVLELLRCVHRRAKHTETARIGDRGDDIPAVAKSNQRQLDAQHVADRGLHVRTPSVRPR